MTIGDHRLPPGQAHDRQQVRCSASSTPDNFTIFEGTLRLAYININELEVRQQVR
jgi:hypothetical protein